MRENNRKVLQLLESYPAMKKKIALLQYELERAKAMPSSEFIVAMTFERGSLEGSRPAGDRSDPTWRIAMNYESRAERLKSETVKDIISELGPLNETVDRLEFYISKLEKRQAIVLQLLYFQNRPLEEIAETVGVVVRTVRKIRDRAIDELTQMYDFIEKLHGSKGPL